MKKVLFFLMMLLAGLTTLKAQTITFSPTVAPGSAGYLPSNNSSGGISFIIDNTNPFPAVLTSLTYWNSVAATKDFVLWYAPTTTTMPLAAWPPTVAAGWNPIASVTGVSMGAAVQSTIFPILAFNIPGNTAYRFYLTSANVQYTGTTVIPNPSGVSPVSFSNSGVNFLVAEAQFGGVNAGWGGGNFSPRAFLGSVTLNLLSSPCVGIPAAGTASALPNNPCPGTCVNLFSAGVTAASALIFQWQRASSPTGPWFSIPFATTNPYCYYPPAGSTTFYRMIVTCTSSGLNDTSNVTSAVVVQPWSPTSPCYCNGLVTTTTTSDIGQFTMGTFVNPATLPTPQTANPTATGGVTNYSTLTPSPALIQGLTYPVNIYQITSAAALATCWDKVWIDYNHNANFNDPGEEVFSSSSDASNGFSPSGSFTVPPTSLPGCTKMRVKMQTGGSATVTTPCNNIATGEVEDYIVCINPAGPFDPTISAISAPVASLCPDSTESLSATVCNYGSTAINLALHPFYVTYTVQGPLGTYTRIDTLNSGTLPAFGSSCVTSTITPVNMFAGGNYYINAVVNCPTLSNNFANNDSLANAINIFNYRPTASPPYNLCQYSSIPFGQGLGVSGCSSPIFDTVEIVFNINICNDNIGATANGTVPAAHCADQYACTFATGIIPTLPPGATFTQPAVLKVTNLKENPLVTATINTEMRLNLFKTNPIGANLLSGGGTVGTTLPAGAVANWTYQRNIPSASLSNIFSSIPAGGTLSIGYWEFYQDNISMSDIDINSTNPSVATLTIYYQYVPPAFAWYDVPTGGSSLYSLSPFDPLSYTNAVVNNSNTPGTYTFYAACLGLTGCRVPVDLVINPTPSAFQDTLSACEYAVGANNAVFDLTTIDDSVSGNNLAASVSYFGDQALQVAIADPTNDTSSTNFIYSMVSYPSTGCYSSDSVLLDVQSIPQFSQNAYLGFACAPNSLDISSMINVFSLTPIDSFYYDSPSYTTLFPNPHTIYVQDTVYAIVKTVNPVGCADTAIAYIDIIPATNFIANQTASNFSNCGSIPCGNILLSENLTETLYTTNDCRKIATVKDSVDGINLGTVTICEDITCGIDSINMQPYVARVYDITPTNNGKAMVCLYYLDQDFADYNAAAFPAWPAIDTTNLCITQVDNGDVNTPGHTAVSIPTSSMHFSYDPLTTVWTVCFPVDSFSYFYCHTCNPLNTPLPVQLMSFTGARVNNTSELKWITSNEQNNSHFVVERSKDGKNFTAISTNIKSKAAGGNSQSEINYSYTDLTPFNGHDYYRLAQYDIDGHESHSGTVDVYFGNESVVTMYPNPVNTELTVEVNTPKATEATLKIIDAAGRTVQTVLLNLVSGQNSAKIDMHSLSDGVYMVTISNNKGLNYSQSIRKK